MSRPANASRCQCHTFSCLCHILADAIPRRVNPQFVDGVSRSGLLTVCGNLSCLLLAWTIIQPEPGPFRSFAGKQTFIFRLQGKFLRFVYRACRWRSGHCAVRKRWNTLADGERPVVAPLLADVWNIGYSLGKGALFAFTNFDIILRHDFYTVVSDCGCQAERAGVPDHPQ